MKRLRHWLEVARERFRKAIHYLRELREDGATRAEKESARERVDRRRKAKEELARRLRRRRERRQRPDWNGCYPVLNEVGADVVCEANDRGLIVTSTTGGVHATTSYHYLHRAIDFGHVRPGTEEARNEEVGFQNWLEQRYPDAREIFGPAAHYVKNGFRYGSAFPDHGDHVHFAF